jgi:hypothetical protein
LTATVALDELGTVWCGAVLDRMTPPTTNQIVAAGFVAQTNASFIATVVISSLIRDTEYDVYCYARDDGTKSAANDAEEVFLSTKNAVDEVTVIASKTDAHVRYDSLSPLLLSTDPVNNAVSVATTPTITLAFNEDVAAGSGDIILRATGETDVTVAVANVAFLNTLAVFTPGTTLASAKIWHVIIPDTLIRDLYNNAFAGIAYDEFSLQTA